MSLHLVKKRFRPLAHAALKAPWAQNYFSDVLTALN
jgi:hypothetical protein